MRVLFVGPTLFGVDADLSGLSSRPPAMQGDIAKAVLEGATAIGLVDGYFGAVAAPWHKEILFALESGVAMFGASSMGALRAAECAAFGMRPIGEIANAYCSGALDDDAAVALSHGPIELGYPPLTEPLVNVQPTLTRLRELGIITEPQQLQLWARACGLFFKDRSDEAIFSMTEYAATLPAYRKHRINLKAEDALLLITELRHCVLAPKTTITSTTSSSFFATQVLPDIASQLASASG